MATRGGNLSYVCAGLVVFLFVVGTAGQNQVPPGRRRPPFIVVPPESERNPVSSSNRRDVSAAGPEVVLRPDEQIMVPEQRPQPGFNNPLPAPNQPEPQPPQPQPQPQFPQTQPQPQPQPQPQFPQTQPQPQPQPQFPQTQPEPHLPILWPLPGSDTQMSNGNQPAGRPALNRPNLPPVEQSCFRCICMAASGCNQELKCVQPSPNQYFCGQYHISWAYWADSGKPGDRPGVPGAWEDCLLESVCAERSIQSYMNKFANDCNNDGIIDCVDFARIHKAGPPPSCNASWVDNTPYWGRFLNCWRGGIDLRSRGGK